MNMLLDEVIDELKKMPRDEYYDKIMFVIEECEKYQALYHDTYRKLTKYRDVASKPDIYYPVCNKDLWTTPSDMRRAYENDLANNHEMHTTDIWQWLFTHKKSRI